MLQQSLFCCRPQHATWVFDMVDEFYIGDLEN
uniref:Uncharacterized protein n=1 Tax=Nelumbo nucifera TaxID=4432 RepID=A0A822ZRW9_NELNU|nr:TPA_asm: hypothetical protein HUJ06_002818 [Nelumbo nucifera]